jgi:hypothetical protein
MYPRYYQVLLFANNIMKLKECIISAIDLLGKAMHPAHLKKEFIFKFRDELLKQIIVYLTPTNKDKLDVPDQIRINGIAACTTLVYPLSDCNTQFFLP